MSMTIGVDPGLSGAIAFYQPFGDLLEIEDIPVFALVRAGKTKRDMDVQSLVTIFRRRRIDPRLMPGVHVWLEQVGAMPGQGVSSMFAFGQVFGIIKGVLAALSIPMTLVPPVRWKKAIGVPAAKDGARARASQLLPGHANLWPLVKHDGRAEAALIAYYGSRQQPL